MRVCSESCTVAWMSDICPLSEGMHLNVVGILDKGEAISTDAEHGEKGDIDDDEDGG